MNCVLRHYTGQKWYYYFEKSIQDVQKSIGAINDNDIKNLLEICYKDFYTNDELMQIIESSKSVTALESPTSVTAVGVDFNNNNNVKQTNKIASFLKNSSYALLYLYYTIRNVKPDIKKIKGIRRISFGFGNLVSGSYIDILELC